STAAPRAETLEWRSFFGDARIKALIELALVNNRDLEIAALRIEQARSLYNIQRTALIPTLNIAADGARGRTPGDLTATGAPVTAGNYAVVAEIPSYEVDFFGRI